MTKESGELVKILIVNGAAIIGAMAGGTALIIRTLHNIHTDVNGKIDKLIEAKYEAGKYQGHMEAIPLAREDRKELVEAIANKPGGDGDDKK